MAKLEAYDRLKREIYSGRLGAGERIVERNLARRFNISRIPLRESLIRLQAEGLIRSVPYSSSFVEDFEPADVLEIYSLRLLFEPFATRLVATNPSQAIMDRLHRLCDRMTLASARHNHTTLERADYAFHHTIVAAAGHRRLLRAYESAHIRIVSLRKEYALLKSQPPEITAQQHLKIIDKVRRRDADGAEQAARTHVQGSLRMLEKALGTTLEQTCTEPSSPSRAGRHTRK